MIDYAQRIAYSTFETLMFTNEMAQKYKHSEGCYVECGVAAGAQIIAMRYGAPNKLIHAFDSFEGIPLPSNRDDQMPGIRMLSKQERWEMPDPGFQLLQSTGMTAVSVEDFKKHMIDSGAGLENLEIHKGWFEETMPKNTVGEIAILRLDGDLYNSTFVCLKHLFPKMAKGGVCIIDDWELPGSRQAVYDYFNSVKDVYKWPLDMKFISNIAYFIK